MSERLGSLMISKSVVWAMSRLWVAGFCLWFLLLPMNSLAQRGDPFNSTTATTTSTPGYYSNGGTPMVLTVYKSKKTRLDRQAMVKIFNQSSHFETWQATDGNSELAVVGLQFGHYDIEVSAVGYLTAHKNIEVISQVSTYHMEIVLEPDPSAIALKAADEGMPATARKSTKRGISALKAGNLNNAEKWLDAAYKAAPWNSDLSFLLGYLYYEKKDLIQAQTYLGNAAALNPRDAQALTLLGRLGLQQEDYGAAASFLQKAVDADSEYWMAHHFLAEAYLKQRDYKDARDQATLAIEKGKFKANPAQLVLGQSLVNLGQEQEGIQVLKDFLQDSPKNPAAPQVRNLISELEVRDFSPTSILKTASTREASLVGVDPLIASPEPTFSVKPWQPPGVDDVNPSVAADAPCPYERVMEASGDRVKQLVDDVSRIAATEHLLHEQLDEVGNPITKDTREFNYVASLSEDIPGFVTVAEYRAEHLGIADFPDQISTSGFATLALVFHPSNREDFTMVCEGLGELRGRATWLVHFRQREDRPARFQDYKVGAEIYALKLKGRAWISADTFQIVRIEADLVSPISKIRLAGEHQVVEYAPVPFAKKDLQLWLPKSAEIYLDFRRHRYYRKHSFDHYMLFSVDAAEKRKEPQTPLVDPQQIQN
jgi:tetratricopeptide (TPR) repeat protein